MKLLAGMTAHFSQLLVTANRHMIGFQSPIVTDYTCLQRKAHNVVAVHHVSLAYVAVFETFESVYLRIYIFSTRIELQLSGEFISLLRVFQR